MPYIGRAPTSTATKLEDADQDTKIQVEESSDEDTIRFDIAGAEDFTMTANTFTASSGSTIAAQALTATTIGSSGGVTITGTTPTLTIGDAGAEDTKIVFDGNAQDYYIGLDDTDDDLKIGLGSTVGTTSHMVFDEAGAVTKPLQPAVFVTLASAVTNLAIDTQHNFLWGTEVYDVNGDMSAATFTAPVTGKYLINYQIRFVNIDNAATFYYINLVASNRSYNNIWSGAAYAADIPYFVKTGSEVVDMDASDTFYMAYYQSGGTAQTDITNNAEEQFMTITLIC